MTELGKFFQDTYKEVYETQEAIEEQFKDWGEKFPPVTDAREAEIPQRPSDFTDEGEDE